MKKLEELTLDEVKEWKATEVNQFARENSHLIDGACKSYRDRKVAVRNSIIFSEFVSGDSSIDKLATMLNLSPQHIASINSQTRGKFKQYILFLIESASEKTAQTTIGALGLSIRSYNALSRAGIRTVKDLTNYNPERLGRIRKLGDKGVLEIRKALSNYDKLKA